jgi:hypothetical protein
MNPINVTAEDVDETPQSTPSTPAASTPTPSPALTAEDVDSLPPGLMKKPVVDPSQTAEDKPTAEEHRERLSSAVRDLDQFRARKGHVGATWTSRKTGKTHTVGDRVSVDGHTGVIERKHESSGLPVIKYDK